MEKYTSGSWTPTSYRKYSTDTDVITTFPKTVIGDGTAVSAYTVKGDMEQSGTPTPSAPIYPAECGELVTSGEHAGQYAVPLTLGNTTTPIYLGEVQSNRQIKKLVLDGTENWTLASNGYFYSTHAIADYNNTLYNVISTVFSHYTTVANKENGNNLANNEACLYARAGTSISVREVYIRDTQYSTAEDFKTYLSQQYANGTPVTVWYVLATPTTTTLNEPLRKIGTYTDSVSGSGLPTSGQAESFDVGTTLKPSEVSLTYHGWHEKRDKVYTNGNWMENT